MPEFKSKFFQEFSELIKETNPAKTKNLFLAYLHEFFLTSGRNILKELLAEVWGDLLPLIEEKFLANIIAESESFLDVKQTCAFLNIKRTTLHNHSKRNPHFPKPKRVSRKILYSKKSLIDFLNQVKNFKREPP